MLTNLEKYNLVLASNSPRRQELLKGLGVDFVVKTKTDLDESYPDSLPAEEVAKYVTRKKATAYLNDLNEQDLIITADTVVVLDNQVLGKPRNRDEAVDMLGRLSGSKHQVITAVCLLSKDKKVLFDDCTEVEFEELTAEEIQSYIEIYNPLDKAGAYGIQEWIGYIGVVGLQGSYFNVMGLPVHRLYRELKNF